MTGHGPPYIRFYLWEIIFLNWYTAVANKLEQGLDTVEDTIEKASNAAGALTQATKLFESSKSGNSVLAIIDKARQSFGGVLDGVVPPLAIIAAVVGISKGLVGPAYANWAPLPCPHVVSFPL